MHAGNDGTRRPSGNLSLEVRQHLVDARLRRMRAIARRYARLLRKGGPPVDHAGLLYDDRGLPG